MIYESFNDAFIISHIVTHTHTFSTEMCIYQNYPVLRTEMCGGVNPFVQKRPSE